MISQQLEVDKIYLETHRDLLIVDDATLEQAKKFFHDRGIETAGGITYTINEANSFETFCYSNPEHREMVRKIAEHTAKHFDEFILDDFFFTSCKSDIEIKAKGTQSWTEYRLKLMTEAGRDLVLKPAKKVNPRVKVIIKYPTGTTISKVWALIWRKVPNSLTVSGRVPKQGTLPATSICRII